MPLSEEEQRILDQIERSFYESDPAFAREVSSVSIHRLSARNAKLSAVTFVVGLLVLLTQFANMFWLGAVGFLMMLGSAFVFVSNIRRLSRSGFQQVAQTVRARSGTLFADRRRSLRQRFKRDD